MNFIPANYKTELSLYDNLCNDIEDMKILLYEGKSGYGKTTLLRHCLNKPKNKILNVKFCFKSGAISIGEIFFKTIATLGETKFVEFNKALNSLSTELVVNVSNIEQLGTKNRIELALYAHDESDKKFRELLLTEAWWKDLQAINSKVVFVFDTFEKVGNNLNDWIISSFLPRIPYLKNVKVVIAGQNVPDSNNIDWGEYCKHIILQGISNPHEWVSIIEQKNKSINFTVDSINWLHGVCNALQGSPALILKIIDDLPEKEKVI